VCSDDGKSPIRAHNLRASVHDKVVGERQGASPHNFFSSLLNEICAELNLATHAGQNAKDLKRAFLQNASAFITAKFNYRANDGTERHVEAGVTRYGVIFTGEKLPDGRKADAVYISFNDPFWEVLNNAPVRPLDRTYMKELPPAAQRFYEIISRKMFAALKNDYARAKISYSEYCTFSAQLRHFERQRVQDQMAKVLRPHKASGYIAAVKYEPIIDAQSKPDWILYFTPGPKAHTEFAAAHTRRKVLKQGDATANERGDDQPRHQRSVPRQAESKVELVPSQPKFDSVLVSELTRRGISEKKTHELLTNLKPGQEQNLVAQLEHAEHLIKQSQIPITNPAGFIIRLIQYNTPVPDNFETSAQRTAREERERNEQAQYARAEARRQLEWEYETYQEEEIDRSIAANPAAFEAIKNTKWKEDRERYSFAPESIARAEARHEIRKQLTFLTFDEFLERKKQGTDFFLKPVGPSPVAEPAAVEPEAKDPVAVAEIDAHAAPSDPAPAADPQSAMATETMAPSESEVQPAIPGPLVIEVVCDRPQDGLGGPDAEQGIA